MKGPRDTRVFQRTNYRGTRMTRVILSATNQLHDWVDGDNLAHTRVQCGRLVRDEL